MAASRSIGNLLGIGVTISLVLLLVGVALTFVQHPDYVRSSQHLTQLTSGPVAVPHTWGQIRDYVSASIGRAMVMAGLLVLILTPVARVAVSTMLFVRQRDWAFAVLTGIVLTLLALSFLLGVMK